MADQFLRIQVELEVTPEQAQDRELVADMARGMIARGYCFHWFVNEHGEEQPCEIAPPRPLSART